MTAMVVHRGGCHCGGVRVAVEAPAELLSEQVKSSVCTMTGFLHLIVPASRFRLSAGEELLESYAFNTGVAKHLFCRRCGVKSFYRPRSNPDGWSVNARCLDAGTVAKLELAPFDGRNWEQAGDLAHLSAE